MGAHAHGTLPVSPAARRVLQWVMVPLALATVVAVALLWPDRPAPLIDGQGGTFYRATVTAVHAEECPGALVAAGYRTCGTVTVRLADGPDAGRDVVTAMPGGPGAPRVAVGDRVKVHAGFDPADPSVTRYDIAEHERSAPVLWLVALFAAVIVAFGRWRGLASLAGLLACFALLVLFVLPGILGGHPPLLVAVVGAAMVLFVVMFLVHGVSVGTAVAVLGTLGAVVLTGVLGVVATALTHLTGFVDSEEQLLWHLAPDLDLRGVLLAGIIIGSLGVLDDVTISQTATVGELARADPGLSRRELYRAGIRVGRAHVASVVNTLVLAYAGASLPLLLLIVVTGGRGVIDVLTTEALTQEIVRSVVATVGLVAAVPLTTGLAAFVCGTAGRASASEPTVTDRDDDGGRVDAGYAAAPGWGPAAYPPAGRHTPWRTESDGGWPVAPRHGWPDGDPGPWRHRVDPGEALAPRRDDDPTGWC